MASTKPDADELNDEQHEDNREPDTEAEPLTWMQRRRLERRS